MIAHPATATPTEIDTELYRLYIAAGEAEARVAREIGSLRKALGQRPVWRGRRQVWTVSEADTLATAEGKADAGEDMGAGHYGRTWADQYDRYTAAVAKLATIEVEVAPLDAEYVRRGRWNRYFMAQSSNGHYHRSMRCSTCNRGAEPTRFAWNPEMSGMAEADAIAELGRRAAILCTVCFPGAPVAPAAPRPTREQVAAAKAAAAAQARKTDPKLIADVDGAELRVDGATLRTVRSAEIAAVDHLGWAAYGRHIGEPNEPYAAGHEANARKIVAALAAKAGTTEADTLAEVTAKAIKKARRELGADVAAAAAAVWAEQAAAAAK
jgi:hypothetical protein